MNYKIRRWYDSILLQAEHRLEQLKKATDRIQKEIEEVTEREHELRNVGSIKTTSHETVDSKVRLKLNVYTCRLRVHIYIRVDQAQGRWTKERKSKCLT